MDNPLFWIFVVPVMIVAALWYLGFVATGMAVLTQAFRSKSLTFSVFIGVIAIGIIAFPFAYPKIFERVAKTESISRDQYLRELPRYDIRQKKPRRLVNMGKLSEADLAHLRKKYRLREFHSSEDERLREAYEKYRRTEYCIKYIASKKKPRSIRNSPLGAIPSCSKMPESLPIALDLNEPAVFFVEGFNTAYRLKGPLRGKIYELRYVSETEDYLLDYFEQRTIRKPKTPANTFSSGRDLDRDHKPPRRMEFVEEALSGKKANAALE